MIYPHWVALAALFSGLTAADLKIETFSELLHSYEQCSLLATKDLLSKFINIL
jgi:hypothetical protein